MMEAAPDKRHIVLRAYDILSQFAVFLILGTASALIWANIHPEAYIHFIEHPLFYSSLLSHSTDHAVSLHFLVNDIFMCLFFGIAMKEVTESVLPKGALSSFHKAAMPALATVGGVLGPIAVFFILHTILSPEPAFAGGWAIPTATDIAYCWVAAAMLFGRKHPAVTFLLVLAVLDDLIGMIIIATFYTAELQLQWLCLVFAAMLICEGMRRGGVKHFWPYLVFGGALSWFGLHEAGVHTALALAPVVPFMPHAERDAGLFVDDETGLGGYKLPSKDTLSHFERRLKPIVDIGLFGFGLTNAGVVLNLSAFASKATWIIFLSLLVGKTLGVFSFAAIGDKMGLKLPIGVTLKQTLALGMIAGIGFTVALFVTSVYTDAAVDPAIRGIADQLKLGALLSFLAAPLGYCLAKILKVERID